MIWVLIFQQPSEYLGITVGKLAVFQGEWVEVVMQQTLRGQTVDTDRVTASFDYNGHQAFELSWTYHVSGDTSYEDQGADTLWDNPPYLMDRGKIGDTPAEAYWLKTPFSVGDKWGTGLEGTYQGDFDGDGNSGDVMEIRSDTIEVVGEEDVSVPAGTFHAFKLKETLTGAITQCTSILIDSIVFSQVRYFWWSPGDYSVKDTVHQDFTAYVFGTPYPGTYDSYSELTFLTEVKETSPAPAEFRLWVEGDEVHLLLPEGFSGKLRLYDSAGRLALEAKANGPEATLSIAGLKAGVYILKAGGASFKVLKR